MKSRRRILISVAAGAACAATLAGMSEPAQAQSSVTLYGEMDTGVDYVSNVGGEKLVQATSGLIDGSFWGMRGSEDLGGGNRAIFTLEHGFSVTNGESFNDHPFYVGLGNDAYGTITLGHQYDSIHDYLAPLTLTGSAGGTAFAHPLDNDNANNSYLARNSVKFTSASFGGFSFGGMYAFSNGAGEFANNRAYSIGLNYQKGPFNAGAAYLHNDGRGSSTGAYDSVVLPGPDRTVFDAVVQRQNTYGVGASYAIGDLTLGAVWSRSTYSGVSDADSGQSMSSLGFNNYEVNGIYQFGPTFTLAGLYTYTSSSSGGHWNQGALQADYIFSKRTDVYLETVYERASGNLPAIINTADASSGSNQVLVGAGIRHRF